MTWSHDKMPGRIAHKMERFLCHEHTTAIAEPSPIPVWVKELVVWLSIWAKIMVFCWEGLSPAKPSKTPADGRIHEAHHQPSEKNA